MNILSINHYSGPSEHYPSTRTINFALEWTKLGHDVTVVCASYSLGTFKYFRFSGSHFDLVEKGIQYVILKTPRYKGNGVTRLLNIFTFLFKLWRWYKWLDGNFKPDVIIAGSAHTLDCFPAVRVARRCGALFVRDVRDLWPLTLTELGGYSKWHPVVLFFRIAEYFSYRNADLIITTLPNSLEYMQEHGLGNGKWIYIPQGIHVKVVKKEKLPETHRELLNRLNKKGLFIIGYAGSMGLSNCLDTLLDSALVLRDISVAFVLIGSGPEKENLKKKADQFGLKNVYFLPEVPQACVPLFLDKVSATFISWKKKPLYRYGISPNKLMDYMRAGKPVIHAVQANNDIVAKLKCGISVPPEDPAAVAKAVHKLMSMTPQTLRKMGNKGREYVKRYRDYSTLAIQYLKVIEEKKRFKKIDGWSKKDQKHACVSKK